LDKVLEKIDTHGKKVKKYKGRSYETPTHYYGHYALIPPGAL
jgi:hypothetical protein